MNKDSLEFHSMNFNFALNKLNKQNSQRKHYGKILTVRLPCNPIFPIGPIYLADHIHKCFPNIEQQFIDLAIIPSSKVSKYLLRKIDTLFLILVFSPNSTLLPIKTF